MASDTEKRDQDVRGPGQGYGEEGSRMDLVPGVEGYVQAEGIHEHARGSQLRHGTPRNRPWLPSVASAALLKSASPIHLHPSPWTRSPWHLKQCFVHCDTSSPHPPVPSPVPDT